MSRNQKGKTNLDFTGARDSEWQWHQLDDMQVCTALQTDNHAITPPLSFLQAGCPSCRPTNSVKTLKAHQSTEGTITESYSYRKGHVYTNWMRAVRPNNNKAVTDRRLRPRFATAYIIMLRAYGLLLWRRPTAMAIVAVVPPRPQDGTVSVIVLFTIVSSCVTDCICNL